MNEDLRAPNTSLLPMLAVLAVALLALLFVADDHALTLLGVRLAPAGLGIAGLLFVAAALLTIGRAKPPAADGLPLEARIVPLMIECGLWVLAFAYAVRLTELARG
jgi:hypothetical protein